MTFRTGLLALAGIASTYLFATPAAAQGGIRGFFKELEAATRPPAAETPANVGGTARRVPDGFMIDPAIVHNASSSRSAWHLQGRLDQEFAFRCSGGERVSDVYGSGVYGLESSICGAAAHAGRLSLRTGGIVVLRVGPGRSGFVGSTRNGVTSQERWEQEYSFTFVDPPATMLVPIEAPAPAMAVDPAAVQEAAWHTTGHVVEGRLGQVLAFRCPPSGRVGELWGTGVYTIDSPICSAAAHEGRITVRDGGVIGVEVRPGQNSYVGSTRHGVPSQSYDEMGGSFVIREVRVVAPAPAAAPSGPDTLTPASEAGGDTPRIVEGENGGALRLPAAYAAALRTALPAFRPFTGTNTVDLTAVQAAAGGTQSDHAAVVDLNGDGILDVVLAGALPGRTSDEGVETVVALLSTRAGISTVVLSRASLSWQGEGGEWLTNRKVTLHADGARPWVRYADVDLKEGGWEWRFTTAAPTKRQVTSSYQD